MLVIIIPCSFCFLSCLSKYVGADEIVESVATFFLRPLMPFLVEEYGFVWEG